MGKNHLDSFVGKRQQMDKPRSQGEPRRLRVCFLASCSLCFPLRACAKPSPHPQLAELQGRGFSCACLRLSHAFGILLRSSTEAFHSQPSCDHLFLLSPDIISLGSNAPTSSQSVSSQVGGIGRNSEVASERKVRGWEDSRGQGLAEQLHIWTTGPSLNHSLPAPHPTLPIAQVQI